MLNIEPRDYRILLDSVFPLIILIHRPQAATAASHPFFFSVLPKTHSTHQRTRVCLLLLFSLFLPPAIC